MCMHTFCILLYVCVHMYITHVPIFHEECFKNASIKEKHIAGRFRRKQGVDAAVAFRRQNEQRMPLVTSWHPT